MRFATLGLALFIFGFSQLEAANYYIDYVGGSDFNPGTSPKVPWRHCPGDPAAVGSVAAVSLGSGDTVNFKGGVTYVFTGGSGIALNWSGASNAVITYDGNSAGQWGSGRALFTDGHSSRSITGFHAIGFARNLAFKSLELAGIGGEASLPWNTSTALAPRYGGGIAFAGGCEFVTIDGCVFRELGYWFNQKPMSANSIRGVAVSANGASHLTISNSDFSKVANAVDFSAASAFADVNVVRCAFRDAIVWPISLPVASNGSESGIAVRETTFVDDNRFADGQWLGFGYGPRTEVIQVPAGTSVSMGASAVASPAAAFQWRRNGLVIPGATGVVLTLNPVGLADSGVYTALASNSAGSALSNSAVLLVDGTIVQDVLPVITLQPVDLSILYLGSAAFSVLATGTPAPTYQWLRNGQPIPGATSPVLSLFALTVGGDYSVVVSNSAGSVVSRAARLSIGKAVVETTILPSFTAQPSDVAATVSSTVSFVASATGIPAPGYQWRRDGVEIPGATNSSLTLTSVTLSDAGRYSVVARNILGSTVSNDATLTVSQAPVFTQHPANQTATAGATVTFWSVATGTPEPTFQWRKDGVAIFGATTPTLQLFAVTKNDQATYSVVAKNAVGLATSNSAALLVEDPVPPPPPPPSLPPPSPPPPFPPPPPTATDPLPVEPEPTVPPPGPVAGVRLAASQLVTLVAGGQHNVSFTIGGVVGKKILVRVVGPTLSTVGVTGVLADPKFVLSLGKVLVGQNDNWGGGSELMTAFSQAGAIPFVSPDSKDAALLMIVSPGTYYVIVSSVNGLAGSALIEAYEFP